jgi:prepilin-type processing-associated H-X9-DG protein
VPEKFPADFKDADLKDLILPEDGCSYGWDPTKTNSAEPSCAIIADKPDVPGDAHDDGDAKGNSPNHDKAGQNIAYIDGHVKWSTTPAPDSRGDKDVYKGGKEYALSADDAKIIR